MNIFEELAESYTYNGVVSLKALDDDIVTLENQIDSYNATLKELQLRGKKPGPLVGKIRDAKIRLSLLKAVYKRESDKDTTNDVILNMLGVSANNANEVKEVATAADGREPKPQNFESAELEPVVDEPADGEVKSVENEIVTDKDVVIPKEGDADTKLGTKLEINDAEKDAQIVNGNDITISDEDTADMQSGLLTEDEDEDVIIVDENASEKELNDVFAKITSDDVIVVRDIKNAVHTPKEVKEPEVKSVNVPKLEANPDTKLAKTEGLKTNEDIISQIECGEDNTDYSELNATTRVEEPINEDDKDIVMENNIKDGNTEIVPPPTIDDYLEPEVGPNYENITYDEDGVIYEAEDEPDLNEIPADKIFHGETTIDFNGDIVAAEQDKPAYDEVRAYDAFEEINSKIYASFDLSDYTDMVNTDSIKGYHDNTKKELQVTFTDLRDYGIFIKLANEKLNDCFIKRLFKKPKSIFMDVYDKIGDNITKHHFEFVGCRIKSIFDSEYQSVRESVYYGRGEHEFSAVFKYKKLKIE